MAIKCVGIFCEDIREEVGGTHTIIGIMPDNIMVTAPVEVDSKAGGSLLFPRLGIYIRLILDLSHKPNGPISAKVSIPGMAEFALGELGTEATDKAFADAAKNNNPMVGVIFKGLASPIQLSKPGLATATVTIEGEEIVCAMLNIQIAQ
jgi:hypothetical protein